jgi:hypothetical protein
MLDFKELSQDGRDLELLIREILLIKGFKVQWSGVGADGGRDLVCYEERQSEFLNDRKKWLIQCKHNAHAGNSVGIGDLDEIVDSSAQHNAKAYLLVCSTYPSSTVINRLEAITNNQAVNLDATYWDATIIEQKLSTPELWKIAQTFFPKSSRNSTWQFYATEHPNHWIVNFKGYHFHLSNRIGSTGNYHFKSIIKRIEDIEAIVLKDDHFIRIRAVYFDDKNGHYSWFIDYMFPQDEKPVTSPTRIAKVLGDGYALEDGQGYSFDVISRPYFKYSDHYDKDHYDYYVPYLENFRIGFHRDLDDSIWEERSREKREIREEEKVFRESTFSKLAEKLKSLSILKLLRAVNSDIEDIDKFVRLRDWSEIVEKLDINTDHFFSTWFLIDIKCSEKDFLEFISYLPQEGTSWFRLTKVYVFVPKDNDVGSVYDESDNSLFELSIRLHPVVVHSAMLGRQYFNEYFESCIKAIEKYETDKKKTNAH